MNNQEGMRSVTLEPQTAWQNEEMLETAIHATLLAAKTTSMCIGQNWFKGSLLTGKIK